MRNQVVEEKSPPYSPRAELRRPHSRHTLCEITMLSHPLSHNLFRVTAFVFASAILLWTTGCGGETSAAAPATQPAPQAVEVTTAPVQRLSVERLVDVVGTLHGVEETTLASKVSGQIVAIHADVGDRVPPGQVLAQIDPKDYELAVTQAELEVAQALSQVGLTELPQADFDPSKIPTVQRAALQAENARSRFERSRQLFEREPPAISAQDYGDQETAYKVAQADHEVAVLTARAAVAQARTRAAQAAVARQQLADTTVRAPAGAVSGYAVAERLVSVGEFAPDGSAMFRLVADDPVKLRASAPERFASEIRVGQTVRLQTDSLDRPVTGTISRVSPQVDQASRTFRFEAVIPNPAGQLRPGAFARATVVVGEDQGVPFVPQSAVVTFAGVSKVFSIQEGKAVEHTVETAERREGLVQVTKGISDQAEVISSGANRLARGTPVQPVSAQ